jgi:hypothetical protein
MRVGLYKRYLAVTRVFSVGLHFLESTYVSTGVRSKIPKTSKVLKRRILTPVVKFSCLIRLGKSASALRSRNVNTQGYILLNGLQQRQREIIAMIRVVRWGSGNSAVSPRITATKENRKTLLASWYPEINFDWKKLRENKAYTYVERISEVSNLSTLNCLLLWLLVTRTVPAVTRSALLDVTITKIFELFVYNK